MDMDVDVDPPAPVPEPNTTSHRASAKPRKANTRKKPSPSVPPPTPWPSPFFSQKIASAPARTASLGPACESPTSRQPEGGSGDGVATGDTRPSVEVSAPPCTLSDAAAAPQSPQPDLYRITIGNKRRLQELRVLLATQQGYLEACEELAQWCDDGRAYSIALSAELDKTLKALAEQSIAPGYDLRPAMTVLEVVSRWRDSMSVMAHANLQRYVEFIIMHMEHRRTHELYRSIREEMESKTQQLPSYMLASAASRLFPLTSQFISPSSSHMLPSWAPHPAPSVAHFSTSNDPALTTSAPQMSAAASTASTSSEFTHPVFMLPHSPLLSEGAPSPPAFGHAAMEAYGSKLPMRFCYAGVGDDPVAGDCGVHGEMEVAEAGAVRVATGEHDVYVKYDPDSQSGDPSPRAATTPSAPSPTLTPRAPPTPVLNIAGIDPLAAASMAAAATVAEAVCAESSHEPYVPVNCYVWPCAPMDPYASATHNEDSAACLSSNSCSSSSAPSPHPSSVPPFSRFPSRPGSPNPYNLYPTNNPLSGTNDPHLPILASELQEPDLFGGWDWSGSSVVASSSIEGALGTGSPQSMQVSAGGDMACGYDRESALDIFDVDREFSELENEI
ncbi:hypothetical protein BDK51DRAFT_34220 [Blyttiomyces helicus]|uniref:ZMIZ1 N-terminal domain-containing protein n=1 Tax=Blyttiomyces helicus TaxID=388810 RepID=A0A4P9W3Y8_9FUNG|nr:hypothetical protein BDK51DRAFT_34220 [Blyttiomyces helicus]|eukprot:RKO85360.1 hypothetical protein BDK51DRAFT_34220 [Blyttiomyces helicus]